MNQSKKQIFLGIINFMKSKTILFFLFLCFTASFVYAQDLKDSKNELILIKPENNQQFFTNTNIKFSVIVPNVKPSQLEVSIPEEQGNVIFKTMRRTEEFSENAGTKIELWFIFEKSGEYELKPLSVRINGKTKNILFEKFTIGVNPQNLIPQAFIVFKDGKIIDLSDFSLDGKNVNLVRAGEKIRFTLCLKYAVQLVQYDWDIPKNSIFDELKRYDITELKYRSKVYSEELIPVADFDWIPLVSGNVAFPVFKLNATGYNGNKYEIIQPKLFVEVTSGIEKADINQQKDKYFKDAFDFSNENNENETAKEISEDICYQIVSLRTKERHSLSLKNKNERVRFEKELELPYEQSEFSVFFLGLSIVLVLLFCVLLIFFIGKKRPIAYILIGVIELCSVVFLIFSIAKSSERYGISKGCKIYSVPEMNAESKSEIPAGNRILITEDVGDWFYVELGENGGWCSKEEVIEIR